MRALRRNLLRLFCLARLDVPRQVSYACGDLRLVRAGGGFKLGTPHGHFRGSVRGQGGSLLQKIRNVGHGKFSAMAAAERREIGRSPVRSRNRAASLEVGSVAHRAMPCVEFGARRDTGRDGRDFARFFLLPGEESRGRRKSERQEKDMTYSKERRWIHKPSRTFSPEERL